MGKINFKNMKSFGSKVMMAATIACSAMGE